VILMSVSDGVGSSKRKARTSFKTSPALVWPQSLRLKSFARFRKTFLRQVPEYNHGVPGALKNAIDFLFREWNDKAAGFVSYGGVGGARAVEQLRVVLAEVQMATVRNQVLLSMVTDFENFSVFKPDARHENSVNAMFDQVIAWGGAMKELREKRS
jgi:NAD(P)H-dependent FMN reductase